MDKANARSDGRVHPIHPQANDLAHLIAGELETLLLATVFQSPESAYSEVSWMTTNHFAVEANRILWAAILHVAREGVPSMLNVVDRLLENGKLEAVGGLTALVDLGRQAMPGLGLLSLGRRLARLANDRQAFRLSEKLQLIIQSGGNSSGEDFRDTVKQLNSVRELDGGLFIENLPPVAGADDEITYIREPELFESAVIALTGDSASGKSTLATAYARDVIAAGRPALILDRENPRGIVADRMRRLGLCDGPLLRWCGGWRRNVPEPDSSEVIDWVRKCAVKPLVIIDSQSAFLDGDENSASDMRRFLQRLRNLADLGATALLIHHDGKGSTTRDYRGSSDFKAAVDQAFHVTNVSSTGKLDRLTLRPYKSRPANYDPIVYRYANGQMIRDASAHAPARSVGDQLTDLLRTNPMCTGGQFEKLAAAKNIGRNAARNFLVSGITEKSIDFKPVGKGKHYFLVNR